MYNSALLCNMLWNIIYAQYGYSLKGKFSKINLLKEKKWGKILNLTNPIICHSRRGIYFLHFCQNPSKWLKFLWNHGNKIYIYLSRSISSFFTLSDMCCWLRVWSMKFSVCTREERMDLGHMEGGVETMPETRELSWSHLICMDSWHSPSRVWNCS